jgi:site-specific recombinase XerD
MHTTAVTITAALRDFLEAKEGANRAPATLEKYELAVSKVLDQTGDVAIGEIKPRDLRSIMATMRRDGLAPSTMLTYYTAIKSFMTWCCREYGVRRNPMANVERPNVPRRLPSYLTTDEVQALFQAAKQSRNARKNRAVLTVMLDTGVRSGELCGLRIDCVDLVTREMRVFGKDQDERLVPFGERTVLALVDYWSGRNDTIPTAFHGLRGPLTTDGLRSIMRRLGAVAGVTVSPHLLRHTFAHRWVTGGGDLESLRRILGHSSLAMTQRYAGLSIEHIKDKHKGVNPLRDIK